MSRFRYWIIMLAEGPTSFRSRDAEVLATTLTQLRRTHPEATLKWFEDGKLWDSPEAAEQAGVVRPERRGREWRPGGEHRDPKAQYQKPPREVRKRRIIERMREKDADKRSGPPRDRESWKGDTTPRDSKPRGEGGGRPPREGGWKPRGESAGKPPAAGAWKPRGEGAWKPRDDAGWKPRREGGGKPAAQGGWKPRGERSGKPPAAGAGKPRGEVAWKPRGEGTGKPPAEGRVKRDEGAGRDDRQRDRGPRAPRTEWRDDRGRGPARPPGGGRPTSGDRPQGGFSRERGDRPRNDRPRDDRPRDDRPKTGAPGDRAPRPPKKEWGGDRRPRNQGPRSTRTPGKGPRGPKRGR